MSSSPSSDVAANTACNEHISLSQVIIDFLAKVDQLEQNYTECQARERVDFGHFDAYSLTSTAVDYGPVNSFSDRVSNPPLSDYEKEFMYLKKVSDRLKHEPAFASTHGELTVNRRKNRYKDILPFDSTRVILSEYPGVPGSDYINANFIKGASGSNAYIAAQGPLPHTVNDFWRMVVETDVQVIVMACNETEAGRHKCQKYWTFKSQVDENNNTDGEDSEHGAVSDDGVTTCQDSGGDLAAKSGAQFGNVSVQVVGTRKICADFLVRTLHISWPSESGAENGVTNSDSGLSTSVNERVVCQFHYLAWPDHGIPTHVKPLLNMVRLIRDCQMSETLPVLVHCSAGCGRTGTICAIDYVWGLLRNGKLASAALAEVTNGRVAGSDSDDDYPKSGSLLFPLVCNMRRQRPVMVQTVEQYILIHRAVRELFRDQLSVIEAHPYANVGNTCDELDEVRSRIGDEDCGAYEPVEYQGSNQSILETTNRRIVMGTSALSIRSHSNAASDDGTTGMCYEAGCTDPIMRTKYGLETDKSSPDFEALRSDSDVGDCTAPTAPCGETRAVAQRLKRGQLRLVKTENGLWQIEDIRSSDSSPKQGTGTTDSTSLSRRQQLEAERTCNSDADRSTPEDPRPDRTYNCTNGSMHVTNCSPSQADQPAESSQVVQKSLLMRRPSIKKLRNLLLKKDDVPSAKVNTSSAQTVRKLKNQQCSTNQELADSCRPRKQSTRLRRSISMKSLTSIFQNLAVQSSSSSGAKADVDLPTHSVASTDCESVATMSVQSTFGHRRTSSDLSPHNVSGHPPTSFQYVNVASLHLPPLVRQQVQHNSTPSQPANIDDGRGRQQRPPCDPVTCRMMASSTVSNWSSSTSSSTCSSEEGRRRARRANSFRVAVIQDVSREAIAAKSNHWIDSDSDHQVGDNEYENMNGRPPVYRDPPPPANRSHGHTAVHADLKHGSVRRCPPQSMANHVGQSMYVAHHNVYENHEYITQSTGRYASEFTNSDLGQSGDIDAQPHSSVIRVRSRPARQEYI